MRVVSYDINDHAFPDGIEFTLDLPLIFFFPAYNKRLPFQKYTGSGIARNVLQYCQKNADLKFKFPVDVSRIGLPREDLQQLQQQQHKINHEENFSQEEQDISFQVEAPNHDEL